MTELPQHNKKKNRLIKLVCNIGLFQLGWFICVSFGNFLGILATLIILAIHFRFVVERSAIKKEALLIIQVFLIGIAVEFILLRLGALQRVDGAIFPTVWIILLWVLFATTLNHSLGWLKSMPALSIIFAAIAAPPTYYLGATLSPDMMLGTVTLTSLLIVAVCWAIAFPLTMQYLSFPEKH